jgi:predicted SprT family Zn-dependent metalloprotease
MIRPAMIPIEEADVYIRMTLREWKMETPIVWIDNQKRTLGYYCLKEKKIFLTKRILKSFVLFREVFLHELCHALDHSHRRILRSPSGRRDYHGKAFKSWCVKLKIPARAYIPVYEFAK